MSANLRYHSLREKILDAGLKVTQQRMAIFGAIIEMKDHPTAERIFEKVQFDNPSISFATVYKTLDTLLSAGLISKVHTSEGSMRYDANLDSHNHIYCTNTREIFDYYSDDLNNLLKEFFSKRQVKNLEIEDVKLQINARKIDPDKDVNIH